VRARLGLVALLLGGACASTQKPGAPGLPLGGAVAAVEITADGERIPIPADGITDVDINSTIALTMDAAVIAADAAKVAGGSAATRSPGVDLVAPLRAMDDVTKAQQASSERLTQLTKQLAAGHGPSAAELAELGVLQGKVVAALRSYCAVAGLDRTACSNLLSETGYTRLNNERSRLLALVQAQLEQFGNLRWRLEATSSRTGSVHLPNYDDLPEGASTLVNKIALHVDDQTRQNFAAAQDLSRDLNKLIDERGSLTAALEPLLLDELQQAKAAWEDWAKQDLSTLAALVDRLTKSLAADPDAKAIVADAGVLRQQGQDMRDACTGALTTVQNILASGSLSALSAIDFTPLLTCATAVEKDVPNVKSAVQDASARAQKLIDEAKSQSGAVFASIKDQIEALQTVVHAKEALDKVQTTWSAVAGGLRIQTKVPAPVWRTDHFQDQPLSAAVATAIDLPRTNPRQEGDTVFFKPSITKDGVPALVGVQKALRLRKEGARVDVSAAITFVRPRALQDGEDAYRAAPAVTAALHYRDWRGPGKNSGNALWNFLDPGIGFHVVYPDLGHNVEDATGKVVSKDPSTEIGVGGVVQLLGDLFQAGYGYDIQVGRQYWFFGFGLQRLMDLGVSLPLTGQRTTANQ